MSSKIWLPLSKPSLNWRESIEATRAIRSGWISGSGHYVRTFEDQFAKYTDSKFAFSVSNGTAAIHLALASLGVGQGDEVIVPAFGFVAFANAVLYVGAIPVFVDVEPQNWCLDPRKLESKFTKKTKAVIAVHNYGSLGAIEEIAEICKTFNIPLIEDCAEALGGRLDSTPAGSFGQVATYSFYGNKIITCGEGGAITTQSSDIAERIQLLRGQGMDPKRRYYFPVMGYNYRLSNISSAVLVSQLKKLPHLLEDRWRVFDHYQRALLGNSSIKTQESVVSPWLFTVLFPTEEIKEGVQRQLLLLGVETRPCFFPLPKLPAFRSFDKENYEVSDGIWRRGLSLPTFPKLSKKHIDLVCMVLEENTQIE